MKPELIEKLICPFDREDMDLKIFKQDENGEIQEGLFICQCCHRYYPITYGIPIFSPDEYREPALEKPLLDKWGISLKGSENNFKLLKAQQ